MNPYPGIRPIAKVDPPIKMSVSKKVYFLPTLSPNLPKTNAPKGLTMKPAAKVANVEITNASRTIINKLKENIY